VLSGKVRLPPEGAVTLKTRAEAESAGWLSTIDHCTATEREVTEITATEAGTSGNLIDVFARTAADAGLTDDCPTAEARTRYGVPGRRPVNVNPEEGAGTICPAPNAGAPAVAWAV